MFLLKKTISTTIFHIVKGVCSPCLAFGMNGIKINYSPDWPELFFLLCLLYGLWQTEERSSFGFSCLQKVWVQLFKTLSILKQWLKQCSWDFQSCFINSPWPVWCGSLVFLMLLVTMIFFKSIRQSWLLMHNKVMELLLHNNALYFVVFLLLKF